MHSRRQAATVIGLTIVVAIAALAYAFRMPLATWGLAKGIGAATGTSISIGQLSMHGGHAVVRNVRISGHGGERLAYVPRVDATYNLHDLLPGSRHLYGLRSVTLEHPRITIVHNADGSYNLPKLAKSGATRKSAAPMNFTMRVIDGTVSVADTARVDPKARHLLIDGVNVRANVNTAARTRYVASMAYDDAGVRYPIAGHGVIDRATGLNYQRWTAAHIPLPQLVNYALNNATLRLRAGFLDHLDATYYGKIAATADLRGGVVAMNGVNAPIQNVRGPIDLTSAGLTTPHIDASIAGAPIRVSGAIYDLSHPNFRLMVRAHGDVARLKNLTVSAARLPLRGTVNLALLVEGSVRKPLAIILAHSPEIDYRAIPLRNPNGLLTFDGHTATIVNFGVHYGGFTLGARGRMALRDEPDALEAVAVANGPSNEVPYVSSLFPGMTLHGTVLATANSLKHVDTHGVLLGSGSGGKLASAFAISNNGVGSVVLHAPDLQATVAVDHPHGVIDALVRARDFTIHPAVLASLPGLAVKALPAVSGSISGDLFASRRNNALGMLGTVAISNARYGKFTVARANARFGGAPGNVRVASLSADGNFGSIRAAGTIAGTNRIALQGRYNGSLAQVAQLAGNLPARGVVNAPLALVSSGGRIVAQIRDAQFSNASIRGIPLDGLSATVALAPAAIDVYAARATVAQGASAVAAGSIGNGGRLAFSVSKFPVAGGHADAAATATGSLKRPDVRGAALIAGASYKQYPISGASAFTYSGGTASVQDATIDAGPALVAADGTVWPNYHLHARASGLVSYAQFQGSVDADVNVTGSGKTPEIAGVLDVPEGNVHGLAFSNMHAAISGTPQDISVGNGSVAVGSTALAFDAAYAPGDVRADVRAPHADLSDFNDYFDTGDTLAGTGRLALSVAMTQFTLASSGNVDLHRVRYRRFDVGNTVANWRTNGRSTSIAASVGGANGTAHVAGTIVPNSKTVGLNATVRNLNLGTWLPILGYTAPVAGYIDANASVRGRYPGLALNADATLRDGVVDRVAVQRAQIAAIAQNGRGRITQAIVQIPYLTATGSGTFGLHRGDALALAMHATSPDVGKLLQTFSGKTNQIAGVLDTTARVNGTAQNPRLSDALTLTQLRYAKFTVPKVTAALTADKRHVSLAQGVVSLTKGSITASGDVPLHPAANAPIALALTARNVDLADFSAALPKGSTLKGALGGTLRVGGTMRAPLLNGAMALNNGYFVGPIDQNPISNLQGKLQFSGTKIALTGVHANVGGGTLAMNGTAFVPTLRDLRAVTFNASILANNAQIDSPKYFRGKVDGNIHAYRTAGGLPTLAGTVNVPSARIPLTAFWNPKAPKKPKGPPLPLAFDLTASAGRDVRVQSPNVDVGATGSVTVTGTLAKPALSGRVASTGGTVNFFRDFQIQRGVVRFDPSNGFWPNIDAVADTQIGNPLTYIQLRVTGLAPNQMQLSLHSDPSYDRTQILGLLAGLQNFGAVPGIAATGAGTGGFTLGGAVQNLAMGQLNTLFTRNIFEPLDVGLGSALGLDNLQISDSFTSGFGVNAVKAFGKHVTASFSENLGEPKEQSLSLEAHHGTSTAFTLMLYSVQDPPLTGFLSQNTNPFKFNDLFNDHSTLTAVSGTNGFSLLYEHKFH